MKRFMVGVLVLGAILGSYQLFTNDAQAVNVQEQAAMRMWRF